MRSTLKRLVVSVLHYVYCLSAIVLDAVAVILAPLDGLSMQRAEAELAQARSLKPTKVEGAPLIGSGSGDSPLRFVTMLKSLNGTTADCEFA